MTFGIGNGMEGDIIAGVDNGNEEAIGTGEADEDAADVKEIDKKAVGVSEDD
jgi:hypothetical protein